MEITAKAQTEAAASLWLSMAVKNLIKFSVQGDFMTNCKNIRKVDVTPWHGDALDHPIYKYICCLSEKEVIPYYCNGSNCSNYIEESGLRELESTFSIHSR